METPIDLTSIRFTARHSKVLDKIRVYASPVSGTPPPYTFGIQADDGTGRPSGTYLSSADYQPENWDVGWCMIDIPDVDLEADSVYHIVICSTENYISDWENHIAIRRSFPQHGLIPRDQAEGPEAFDREASTLWTTLAGDSWAIQNWQPIYVLDFTDGTYDGNPYAIAGYVDPPLVGDNFVGQVFSSPIDLRVESIGLIIQKITGWWTEPVYFTIVDADNCAVLENDLFAQPYQVPESYGWVEKDLAEPIWLTGGRTYRFYLWTPERATGYRLNAPHTELGESPYPELTFGGIDSTYTYSPDGGATWIVDNRRDLVFTFDVIESKYRYSSGFLTSSVYDAEEVSYWRTIDWDAITPENTQIVVQVRADNRCPILTNWITVGNGQNLGISARYFQYRVELIGDGVATPMFRKIRIHCGTTPPSGWAQSNWAGGATEPTLESGTWYRVPRLIKGRN